MDYNDNNPNEPYVNDVDDSRKGVYGIAVVFGLLVVLVVAIFLGHSSTPPNPPPHATPLPVHATPTSSTHFGTPVVKPTATLRPMPTSPLPPQPAPTEVPTAPIPIVTAQPTAPIPVITAQPTSPLPIGTIPPPVGTAGIRPSNLLVGNK